MRVPGLFSTLLLLFFISNAAAVEYRLEYDYIGHGDNWYGRPGHIEQRLDYAPTTDIPTQQGDDFGFGYNPALVRLGQGPARARTLGKHTAYEFRYAPLTSCVEEIPPSCSEDMFMDGFEEL